MLKFKENVKLFMADGVKFIGNTENGALIGLDDQGKTYVEDLLKGKMPEMVDTNQALKEALIRNKFFEQEERKENIIKSAYVHVTDNCNLHCVGCYSFVRERNSKLDLPYENICKIMDQLKMNGTEQVVISGGEPFAREDMEDICKYIKSLGIKVMVITNGTKSREAYSKAIPYIDEIAVSIDGYDEETSFIRDKGIMPQVFDTVRFLKEQLHTHMIVTLHKKNMEYMKRYMELSQEMGVPFNYSLLTVPCSNQALKEYIFSDDDAEKLAHYSGESADLVIEDTPVNGLDLACKTRCEAGRGLISIAADGTVYPCHMLHVDACKMGNVLEQPLKDIVFNENNLFLDYDVDHTEECKACKYKYLCGGNCKARAYYFNNKFFMKDDLCKLSHNHIAKCLAELKKRYSME